MNKIKCNKTFFTFIGAAWIDKCRPDLLITESTYATTIRDSKRCRERDFLKKVHDCVEKGDRVEKVTKEIENIPFFLRTVPTSTYGN